MYFFPGDDFHTSSVACDCCLMTMGFTNLALVSPRDPKFLNRQRVIQRRLRGLARMVSEVGWSSSWRVCIRCPGCPGRRWRWLLRGCRWWRSSGWMHWRGCQETWPIVALARSLRLGWHQKLSCRSSCGRCCAFRQTPPSSGVSKSPMCAQLLGGASTLSS